MAYASPIRWNSNHTTIGKLRAFERKSLRTCLQHSEWQHIISNKIIYSNAMIPRIHSFCIHIIHNYYGNLPNINNNIIQKITSQPHNMYSLST